jgi:AraC-like DNA-binding protein
MEFTLDPANTIPLSGEVPIAWRDYLIPIAHRHITGSGKGFQFLIQETASANIRLVYSVYKTTRPIRLHIQDNKAEMAILIAIRGDRTLHIDGLGVLRLKEGQFNAVCFPHPAAVQSLHQPGQEAITLSIQFDNAVWPVFALHFPAVRSFLTRVAATRPALLLESNGWITREIRADLHRLLHTKEAAPGFSLYVNLAARTILYYLLLQSQQQCPPNPYSDDEITAIHAARDIIRQNIRRHFAIPEIAKRTGINECKLKAGFRELFGQGIYGYLQSERMQESARLLTETRFTIKEIADKTGYRSVNSFIKAFRKNFGLTPGKYR